jgi:sulfide:quinone oxidoreductase
MEPPTTFRVAIAGGGVAAVTAMMALADHSDGRLDIDLVCPTGDFVLRPQLIGAPWGGPPLRNDLAALAGEFGAHHRRTQLESIQSGSCPVVTSDGVSRRYDAVLVATGASPGVSYSGVLTVGFGGLSDVLARPGRGSMAVVVPPGSGWTLPAYQLALLAASSGEAGVRVVTPEQRPLEIFGTVASGMVADFLTSHRVDVESARQVAYGSHEAYELADHVVALPVLHGPRIAGLPFDADGFIPVDKIQRVRGLGMIFAAGDITAGSIKQGGLAAHQAERAALAIARMAGLSPPQKFDPATLRGKLAIGNDELYLRRSLADAGPGDRDELYQHSDADPGTASDRPLWKPAAAMLAWRLSRWLDDRRRGLGGDPLSPIARPELPSAGMGTKTSKLP